MKLIKQILLVTLLHSLAFAKAQPSVNDTVEKSVRYLQNTQFQKTSGIYMAGEWPVDMTSYLLPALLGVGKLFARSTDEPTSFASASVVNLLAEIYLAEPTLHDIPKMIDLSVASFPTYKTGEVYSYYRWQNYEEKQVRGPLAKGYAPKYLFGLTNIPADADTTSSTYMALAYADLIRENKNISDFKLPQETLDAFNTHRDVNRKSHYYNWLDGVRKSGAFLTWFQNDQDPNMPRGVFAKPDKGTRIPFGVNDVDCVVNANVLRLLAATNNGNHPGYSDSCEFLNSMILRQKQTQCGIYYPNSYGVFYSIANAYKAGAQCLEKSRDKAIHFILSNQKEDGSWDNEPSIGRTDTVQSTALALLAIMNYDKEGAETYSGIVRFGARYLLSQMKTTKSGEVYWKGEVFFSAVAQARNTVLWRSNAYTTALVTLALIKAKDYIGTGGNEP